MLALAHVSGFHGVWIANVYIYTNMYEYIYIYIHRSGRWTPEWVYIEILKKTSEKGLLFTAFCWEFLSMCSNQCRKRSPVLKLHKRRLFLPQ